MPHVHFTFPEPVQKELEKLIPSRERSAFVSLATEQALKMKRLRETLLSKSHVGTYRDIDPEAWVRTIRKRGRRIIKKLS